MDNKTVAAKQRVTQQTVSKWRARFVIHRLDGLLDAPRPGAPRTIDDARVDTVIAKTLEFVPVGATQWSTRTMARETKLSQTAVTRIWRAFGLQPHRQETFKLSSDPMFVAKVRDIVGLYLDPPLKAMVLCVDSSSSRIPSGRSSWRRRNVCSQPDRAPLNMRTLRRTFMIRSIGAAALAITGPSVWAAPAQLQESDPAARALRYKADATHVDHAKYPHFSNNQHCANCQFYQGKPADANALCALFGAKEVSATGWCNAYRARA
jgi:transposase